MKFILKRALEILLLVGFSTVVTAIDVTIGYQGSQSPYKVAIANKKIEEATGYEIKWKKLDSGSAAINALASGKLQIATAGSSPIAAGISKGIDIQVFWIGFDIAAAEALVVRNGSGIIAPQDLMGKRIGVPFVSTTHFHMLFALEQFNIDPKKVKILNMQPNNIAVAWETGRIDGAFIWDPALSKIKKTGKTLITSGQLSSWGKATFDGMVVNRKWAKQHKSFLTEFIKIVAKQDAEYRNNKAAWNAESDEVADIVKIVGGNPDDVPQTLSLYRFLTLEEQASPMWLGGGKKGGVANALKFTSQFLKKEKKIQKIQKDYSQYVNDSFVKAALK